LSRPADDPDSHLLAAQVQAVRIVYPNGIVVSDAEMAALNIKRAQFHGEWNYTISPNSNRQTARLFPDELLAN
jgi:hypothetical protein